MRKLLFILLLCLITTSVFAQYNGIKPMLGTQIDRTHLLGDPVAFWPLNEGSGNKVFDLSGNGNTGTFNGTAHFVADKFGSAVDLDGDSDWITIPNNPVLTGWYAYTISIWIRRGATIPEQEQIIGKWNTSSDWICRIGTDGKIVFLYGDGIASDTITSIRAVHDGLYHHLVLTKKANGDVAIYIDGVLDNSDTSAITNPTSGSDEIQIGAWKSIAYWFDGIIDIPLLYNRALSASEIALLYREPFCMFEQDDVALMAVEAPTGVVVTPYYYRGMLFIPIIPLAYYLRRRRCVA